MEPRFPRLSCVQTSTQRSTSETAKTASSPTSSPSQILKAAATQSSDTSIEDSLSLLGLKLPANSSPATFTTLPAELRLQIWSYAISSLPPRLIPIREDIKKQRWRFGSPRPHPALASVSSEARAAVFSAFQPLFPPGGPHDYITVNFEKDVILLCNGNRKVKPRTFRRLNYVMGEERSRECWHLAVEVQLLSDPYDRWGLDPSYGSLGGLSRIFPNVDYLTLLPSQDVEELRLGGQKELEGYVEKHYGWVKKRDEWDCQDHELHGTRQSRVVRGHEGLEIHWGTAQVANGGVEIKVWDRASLIWLHRLKSEEERERERRRKILTEREKRREILRQLEIRSGATRRMERQV